MTRSLKPSEIAWPLWGVALSCSWLLPAFSQLWPSFDMELWAAICCLGLLGSTGFFKSPTIKFPPAALVIVGVSLIPQAQFAFGLVSFFGDAWMSSIYLLGFACCIVIGANLRDTEGLLKAFVNSVAFAATVSVGIACAQWLESDQLGIWARALPPGGRPFANLGQPNNLATLITWGLICIWHNYLSRQIRPSISVIAAAYLLFGLSLTQSRTGWLNICTLLVAAAVFRKTLSVATYLRALVMLAALFLALVLMMSRLSTALHLPAVETLASRANAGYRLDHWHAMWLAISQRPWLGWGWNQVSVAQQAVAPTLPPVPEIISYSHDLYIDLLVWNGIPLGALLSILVTGWLANAARRAAASSNVLITLMLITLFTHSLVELPFAYTYFLLPAGLLVGMISHPASPAIELRQVRMVAASLAMSTLAVTWWTLRDYVEARQSFTALRFERARVGTSRSSLPPHLPFLNQLEALATTDRMGFGKATAADVELLRRTSERYPAERTIMQYAVAAAAEKDTLPASVALVKLCKLYDLNECRLARETWESWGQTRYPWLKTVRFPEEP